MLVNGEKDKKVVLENSISLMVVLTVDTLKMVSQGDKVGFFILMVMFMSANGKMIRLMVMELTTQ